MQRSHFPPTPRDEYRDESEKSESADNGWRNACGKLTLFFAGPTTVTGAVIGGIAKGFGNVAGHVIGGVVGLACAPIFAGITWLATKPKPTPDVERLCRGDVKSPKP